MTACPPDAAPARMLSVTALPSTRPGRVVVEVDDEVDTFTAPLLDACLHSQATRPGTRHLVVDLRQVSFLGGAGARAVAQAERLCRRRGARLAVRGGTGIVRHTLQLSGLGDLVSVEPPAVHGTPSHRVSRRRRRHGRVAVPERAGS
jgi:anti-sigma B factor antagonist